MSFGPEYECRHPWPNDCFVQGGTSGIVFTKPTLAAALEKPVETLATVLAAQASPEDEGPGYYRTAFIEAFPNNPKCFLRGEGATVEEAEEKCWQRYQKILACKEHEFERRKRRDGYAYCRHCNLSGMYLPPLENCVICGVATHYTEDTEGKFYCETHELSIPEDKIPEHTKRMRQMMADMEAREAEQAARDKEQGIVRMGGIPVSPHVTHPYNFRVVISAEPGEECAKFDALVSALAGRDLSFADQEPGKRKVSIDLGFGVQLNERQISRIGLGAKAYFDHENPAWNTQIVSTETLPQTTCP